VCLLDVAAEPQRARLLARGDDRALAPRHVAFAEWMRRHVVDPTYRPDVITGDGWEAMQWTRWTSCALPPWTTHVIDTSNMAPAEVAERVRAWIAGHLADERPA
jgi:hypothetical protein